MVTTTRNLICKEKEGICPLFFIIPAQRGLDFWVELVCQRAECDGDFAGRGIYMPAAADAPACSVSQLKYDPVRAVKMPWTEVECVVLSDNHYPTRWIDSAEM